MSVKNDNLIFRDVNPSGAGVIESTDFVDFDEGGFSAEDLVGTTKQEVMYIMFEDDDELDPGDNIYGIRTLPRGIPASQSPDALYNPPLQQTLAQIAGLAEKVDEALKSSAPYLVLGDSGLLEISSAQPNYDVGSATIAKISAIGVTRSIRGFTGGENNRVLIVINVGSNDITLNHQSALSNSSNRMLSNTGADVTITPDKMALLIYDSLINKWRLLLSS